MYEFVYRILYRDGTIKMADDGYLYALCRDEAEQIAQIKRIEVHTSDWREVTKPTMRRVLERTGTNGHTAS